MMGGGHRAPACKSSAHLGKRKSCSCLMQVALHHLCKLGWGQLLVGGHSPAPCKASVHSRKRKSCSRPKQVVLRHLCKWGWGQLSAQRTDDVCTATGHSHKRNRCSYHPPAWSHPTRKLGAVWGRKQSGSPRHSGWRRWWVPVCSWARCWAPSKFR